MSIRIRLPGLLSLLAAGTLLGAEPFNLVSSYHFPSGNLIWNGGFEQSHSNSEHEGWTATLAAQADPGAYGALPIEDAVQAYAGRRMASARFKVVSVSDRYLVSDPIPLKPGTWYTFFMRYRTAADYSPTGANGIRPLFQTFKSHDVQSETPLPPIEGASASGYLPGETWRIYAHRFKTGADATFGTVSLLTGPAVGVESQFYFDDVLLVMGCVRATEGETFPSGCPATAYAWGEDPRHPDFVSKARKYTNGLGKVVQEAVQDGVRDIVTQTIYDELGRPVKSTLPVANDFGPLRHSFIPDILADNSSTDILKTYYSSTQPRPRDIEVLPGISPPDYPDAAGAAYSETRYEASPLARIAEVAGPGAHWKMGAGRTAVTQYGSVTSLPDIEPNTIDLVQGENAEFRVTQIQGIDGQITREYSDRTGKVVRTASKLGNRWIRSTYEYDKNGNLHHVLPPPGSDGVNLVRIMDYDAASQKTYEFTQATGARRYLYDGEGRLRFSETKKQHENRTFSFVRYDVAGRVILNGEILDPSLFTQEKADLLEFPCTNDCRNPDALVPSNQIKIRSAYGYDMPSPHLSCSGSPSSSGSGIRFLARTASNITLACSPNLNEAYEQAMGAGNVSGDISILAIYGPTHDPLIEPIPSTEFRERSGINLYLEGVSESSPEGAVASQAYSSCIALSAGPTGISPSMGRLTKSISCNYELATVLDETGPREVSKSYSYDRQGNITTLVETNRYVQAGMHQVHITKNEYDLQGRVLKSVSCANSACDESMSHEEKFSYDPMGRVSKISDRSSNILVKNHFDFLGSLSLTSKGGAWDGTNNHALVEQYSYHLHGWLTQTKATRLLQNLEVFDQKLFYEDGPIPRYDGSITRVATDVDSRFSTENYLDYSFEYDGLNRLVDADALPYPAGNRNTHYDYHDDGRISFMNRGGRTGTYLYDSEGKISQITGNLVEGRNLAPTDPSGKVFEFDSDGNMEVDHSRSVNNQPMEILYRADGLPYLFTLRGKDGASIEQFVAYDENGNRVTKSNHVDGSLAFTKSYFSGMEVREPASGNPKVFFPMAGIGRISYSPGNPAGEKEIYLRDYQGSTRQLYDLATGEMTYATHYFPYGKSYGEKNTAQEKVTDGFTGKELDGELELLYFGARYYDADLGLWISPDPAMEFPSLYAYNPNPIMFTDPNGECSECDYKSLALLAGYNTSLDAATRTPNLNVENYALAQAITAGAVASAADGPLPIGEIIAVGLIGTALAFDLHERTYVTYLLWNEAGTVVYVGRTSGYGHPDDIVQSRFRGHHMRIKGFGNPKRDRYLYGILGRPAIRGREQQLIDFHGGVGSPRVANSIRGVAKWNPAGKRYHEAASSVFGEIHPYTGN